MHLAIAARSVPRAMRAGLLVDSIAAPLPERAPAPHKRLPRPRAGDRDERGAAIALATRVMRAGGRVGASLVVLDFGTVPLPARWPELAASSGAASSADGDAGEATPLAALGARRATEGLASTRCRWSLDALVREARAAAACGSGVPWASPWEVPSAREALALVGRVRGARSASCWIRAASRRRAPRAWRSPAERLASPRAAAAPSSRPTPSASTPATFPGSASATRPWRRATACADTPSVLVGRPDSTDAEVAAAAAARGP